MRKSKNISGAEGWGGAAATPEGVPDIPYQEDRSVLLPKKVSLLPRPLPRITPAPYYRILHGAAKARVNKGRALVAASGTRFTKINARQNGRRALVAAPPRGPGGKSKKQSVPATFLLCRPITWSY